MKNNKKTETPQNNHKNEKIRVNLCKSVAKIMKNEANLNHLNITATSYNTVVYNVLRTKPKNGTNPNEANLKPISKKEKPQLSGDTQAKNKIMRNKANFNSIKFTANPCGRVVYNDLQPKTKNGTNPNKANFRNERSPIFQKIKKMENEPNCNESDVAASNCYRKVYNDISPENTKRNEPKRTQSKPIKANFPEKGDFQNDVGSLEFLIHI